MSKPYTISELMGLVSPIARRHGVKRVSVFGSYGRGQATAGSDVDLHIEKGRVETLLQLIAIQQDVEDALQVRVDIVTSGIRDKSFLEHIRKDEVMLFEQ